ncbi:MAG: hypothetical protein ACYSR0_07055 [Planctomycetota bacterium]|jgi:hypothetical protein
MNKNIMVKLSFFILAILLIAYGRGYWNQCKLVDEVSKDVSMGRYINALESLEEAKTSRKQRLRIYIDFPVFWVRKILILCTIRE